MKKLTSKIPIKLLISYYRNKPQNFRTLKVSLRPRFEDPEGNAYGKIAKE